MRRGLSAAGRRLKMVDHTEQKALADAACAAIESKRPAGAVALIVAELEGDDSDMMSDYHGSHTVRRVAIGWRTGSREDFRQLRRAAATFPETTHLGPGCGLYRITCARESG